MDSSWNSKMHGHLPRYQMSFDLWSIIHKPSILNHYTQFCIFVLLFHLHLELDFDNFVLFVLVSQLHHRDTIHNVFVSFLHQILHSLHSISRSGISLLFSLIRVHQLAFRIILNIFAWFLFLCSIEIIPKHSASLHFHFAH